MDILNLMPHSIIPCVISTGESKSYHVYDMIFVILLGWYYYQITANLLKV